MKRQSTHRDSRIPEDSNYTYESIRVSISGLPMYGDNNSLIYNWKLQHGDREEIGQIHYHETERERVDTEQVREQIAASIVRVCCRDYLEIECTWRMPRMHIPLRKV